jgi:hypothetical protein
MISKAVYGRFGLVMLAAAAIGFAAALPAYAQAVTSDENPESVAEAPADANDPDLINPELDWSQLNVDAYVLMTAPASKARQASQALQAGDVSWSSRDKPNGAAVLSVKQPLSPILDARIGADMTVTRQPPTLTGSELLSEKLANGGRPPQSSCAAWAAITAPGVGAIWDKTAVEARLDPAQEQGKLGTSLSKSLSLGEQYSLTLQNGYNVIQQGVIALPGSAVRPVRSYETEQSAKLSIADTGTSLTAGQTLSSTDERWLRKVGAEQKLFDGISISGSVGETAQGTTSKSLSAGFKRSW